MDSTVFVGSFAPFYLSVKICIFCGAKGIFKMVDIVWSGVLIGLKEFGSLNLYFLSWKPDLVLMEST
jgi:hypothetical protein